MSNSVSVVFSVGGREARRRLPSQKGHGHNSRQVAHFELWLSCVSYEAMAKLFGSYSELVGGNVGTAFRALTGEQSTIAWKVKQGCCRPIIGAGLSAPKTQETHKTKE